MPKYVNFTLITTTLFLLSAFNSLSAQTLREDDPANPLDLKTALEYAKRSNPNLEYFQSKIEEADGMISQAGQRPNPVVGVQLENFLGSGNLDGINELEITVGVTQIIETADKRQLRRELALRQKDALLLESYLALTTVETGVRQAFVSVLIEQKRLNLRREQLQLAQKIAEQYSTLSTKAANVTHIDLFQAQFGEEQARLDVDKAERELHAANIQLALICGLDQSLDFTVSGEIQVDPTLPSLLEIANAISTSLRLEKLEVAREAQESEATYQTALAKQDVELFGGVRYFNQSRGDAAFLLGIEIPWPLFNNNEGNIRAAKAKVRALGFEKEAKRRDLLVEASAIYNRIATAKDEMDSLSERSIPAAERALATTTEANEKGQFSQIAVLEGKATLLILRDRYFAALSNYATAQIELENLTNPPPTEK